MTTPRDIEDMTDAQDEAPERIWLKFAAGTITKSRNNKPMDGGTEFVRANLARPSHEIEVKPLEWAPGYCEEGPCFKAVEHGEPGKTYIAFGDWGKERHEANRRERILSQIVARPSQAGDDAKTVERVAWAICRAQEAGDSIADIIMNAPDTDGAGATTQAGMYRVMARAALAAMDTPKGGGDGWQPIETAPKDGTRVLVAFDEGEIVVAHYDDGWWDEDEDRAWNPCYARWWMPIAPLPAPPAAMKDGG